MRLAKYLRHPGYAAAVLWKWRGIKREDDKYENVRQSTVALPYRLMGHRSSFYLFFPSPRRRRRFVGSIKKAPTRHLPITFAPRAVASDDSSRGLLDFQVPA